jgi:hypothetical protein
MFWIASNTTTIYAVSIVLFIQRMDFYIKNTNENESDTNPLHVTYYGWHDLPISLWIINECYVWILFCQPHLQLIVLFYTVPIFYKHVYVNYYILVLYTRYGRPIFLAIQKKSEIAFESNLNIFFRASTKVPFTCRRPERNETGIISPYYLWYMFTWDRWRK